jgi:hypothetical protein
MTGSEASQTSGREGERKAWGEFVRAVRFTTLDDIKRLRREGKLDDPRVKAADAWEAALESLLAPPPAEHADDCSLGKHGHPYEAGCDCGRDVTAWLIERVIDGRPHWMRWRDRDRCEWVTDATLADRFSGSEVYREARLIAKSQGVECRPTEHMFVPPHSAALARPADAPAGKWNAAIEALEGLIVAQGRDGMPCWCQNGKNDIVVHSYACATARSVYLTRPDAPAPTDQAGVRGAMTDDMLSDAIARVTTAYRHHFSSSQMADEVHGAIFREVAAALTHTPRPPRDTREDA